MVRFTLGSWSPGGQMRVGCLSACSTTSPIYFTLCIVLASQSLRYLTSWCATVRERNKQKTEEICHWQQAEVTRKGLDTKAACKGDPLLSSEGISYSLELWHLLNIRWKHPFQHVMGEIAQDFRRDLCFQSIASGALQEPSET